MAAANFPNNPVNGDTVVINATTYVYNSTNNSWDIPVGAGLTLPLTSLSVGAEGTPSGDGELSYNNTTGVFTYTPPVISEGESIIQGDTSVEAVDTGTGGYVAVTVDGTETARFDSAGKLLSPNGSAFVGTISDSGNGAIMESGSNANGEYVKFADGTMIMKLGFTITHNSSSFSFARTAPHDYVGVAVISVHGSRVGSGTEKIATMRTGGTGSSGGTALGSFIGTFNVTVSDFTWGIFVITRWK